MGQWRQLKTDENPLSKAAAAYATASGTVANPNALQHAIDAYLGTAAPAAVIAALRAARVFLQKDIEVELSSCCVPHRNERGEFENDEATLDKADAERIAAWRAELAVIDAALTLYPAEQTA